MKQKKYIQNIKTRKGILDKQYSKIEDLIERTRKPSEIEEHRHNTLLKKFDNLRLGENSLVKLKPKINPFEPREIIKPWK